jgi:hypothetical protein
LSFVGRGVGKFGAFHRLFSNAMVKIVKMMRNSTTPLCNVTHIDSIMKRSIIND